MQSNSGETLWSFCVQNAVEETGFLEELPFENVKTIGTSLVWSILCPPSLFHNSLNTVALWAEGGIEVTSCDHRVECRAQRCCLALLYVTNVQHTFIKTCSLIWLETFHHVVVFLPRSRCDYKVVLGTLTHRERALHPAQATFRLHHGC